jgi:hypothetical protein
MVGRGNPLRLTKPAACDGWLGADLINPHTSAAKPATQSARGVFHTHRKGENTKE